MCSSGLVGGCGMATIQTDRSQSKRHKTRLRQLPPLPMHTRTHAHTNPPTHHSLTQCITKTIWKSKQKELLCPSTCKWIYGIATQELTRWMGEGYVFHWQTRTRNQAVFPWGNQSWLNLFFLSVYSTSFPSHFLLYVRQTQVIHQKVYYPRFSCPPPPLSFLNDATVQIWQLTQYSSSSVAVIRVPEIRKGLKNT